MATETAISRNNYFQRTPLTGCYCILLKCLEPEPLVFENIANHSTYLIKNAQSRTYFKCIFNSNILWNLEFAIFDFTRYKTLVHGARFPYSSLIDAYETKSNLFTLIHFLYCSLQVLWKINTTFFPIDTEGENNFSLSQFLQINAWKCLLHGV